jgi:hypothetical protein
MKGTLTYMSPEQAGSGIVDRRSDIFSLGVVLYQLIGGVHPFKAENEYLTLSRILAPMPALPLSSVNCRCPPTLNAVVMRAMEKRRENRWATMAELAEALQRAAAEALTWEPPVNIGAFVRDHVRSRHDRRMAAIHEAERLIEERAKLGAAAPPGPMPSPQLRLTMPSIEMTTGAPTLARAVTASPADGMRDAVTTAPPARRSQRTALIAAGSLVLAFAGTVGAVRTFGGRSSAQPTPAATSEALPAQVPSATPTATASATAAPSTTATSADPEPSASVPGKASSPGGKGTFPVKPKGTGTPANNVPLLTDPGF